MLRSVKIANHVLLRINQIKSNFRISSSQHFSSENKEDFYPSHVQTDNPLKRISNLIKSEIRDLGRGKINLHESEIFPSHVDVLVVGGGIIGSSIAYWIKTKFPGDLKLCIIEKDPSYSRASTVLSVGGIRHQFSLEENIELSMFASEFVKDSKRSLAVPGKDPPDFQFNPHGYLFLATERGAEQLQTNVALQTALGAKIKLMNPTKLKEMFPWLNTSDIALGSYGMESEGWVDPYLMLTSIKNKAMSLKARFIEADMIRCEFSTIPHITVADGDDEAPYEECHTAIVKTPDGIERAITFGAMVIAAGHESGKVAEMLKIGTGPGILKCPLPVEPRKRFVYMYNSTAGPGLDCPFLIDPTGAYFRREGLGGNFLCGMSPKKEKEPDPCNLDVDHELFETEIWPNLAHRVPAFESLKLKSSWAGYYDYNTFDQNAVVGRHPHFKNVYLATGFSGHGIQQAPGIGRAIAELLVDGEFRTINLSRLGFERFIENEPLYEEIII